MFDSSAFITVLSMENIQGIMSLTLVRIKGEGIQKPNISLFQLTFRHKRNTKIVVRQSKFSVNTYGFPEMLYRQAHLSRLKKRNAATMVSFGKIVANLNGLLKRGNCSFHFAILAGNGKCGMNRRRFRFDLSCGFIMGDDFSGSAHGVQNIPDTKL